MWEEADVPRMLCVYEDYGYRLIIFLIIATKYKLLVRTRQVDRISDVSGCREEDKRRAAHVQKHNTLNTATAASVVCFEHNQ